VSVSASPGGGADLCPTGQAQAATAADSVSELLGWCGEDMIVGGCVVLACFLFGGFLALASFIAVVDERDDFYLCAFATVGVLLILGGFALMWNLTRRCVPKRTIEAEESW
jgi:hypothetical protein